MKVRILRDTNALILDCVIKGPSGSIHDIPDFRADAVIREMRDAGIPFEPIKNSHIDVEHLDNAIDKIKDNVVVVRNKTVIDLKPKKKRVKSVKG